MRQFRHFWLNFSHSFIKDTVREGAGELEDRDLLTTMHFLKREGSVFNCVHVINLIARPFGI